MNIYIAPTICPWRFTLKKIFKKLKVLQHKKKASRKLHQQVKNHLKIKRVKKLV